MLGMPAWWEQLVLSEKGYPRPVLINGDIALSNDPEFQGAMGYNKFRSETTVLRPLPWDPNLRAARAWVDNDDYECSIWLQEHHLYLGTAFVRQNVDGIANRYGFHPVMNFFASLGGTDPQTSTWDGQPRLGDDNISSWLTYYCGCKDTPLVRAVGTRWMISAIARIFQPGCQVDCVLILEGKTGIGKSSVFRILGGDWYTNAVAGLGTDTAKEQIIGIWIVELDELDALTRVSDWTGVLSFVSTGTDHFRLKYGRRSGDFPRQCVFGGTTERDTWQREFVGYRRWWPAKCGPRIDLEALREDRDQLWAEALVRYGAGERWWLHERKLIADAAEEQEERAERDPWDEAVMAYCRGREQVMTADILADAIDLELSRTGRSEQIRVGQILTRHRWHRKRAWVVNNLGRREHKYVYLPPEPEPVEDDEAETEIGFGPRDV